MALARTYRPYKVCRVQSALAVHSETDHHASSAQLLLSHTRVDDKFYALLKVRFRRSWHQGVRARVRVWRPLSRVSPRSSTMLIVCSRRQPCGVWLKSCTPYMCTQPTPFHLQCVRSVQSFFFHPRLLTQDSPTRLQPVRTRSSARSLTRDQLAACFAWPLTTSVAVGAA